MHRIHAATLSLALLGAGFPGQSSSQEATSLGTHEHGHLTINIVVQHALLSVELEAPALNVLGFEHAPRTDAQRAQFESQLRWLRSGREAVGVPTTAACRLVRAEVAAPQWSAADGDDHEHEEHADFRATWRFQCANAATLAWLEPWMLRKLLGVEEVTVNLVNGNLQKRLEATSATQRIALR